MRGRLAKYAEIIHRGDDPPAEQVVPDAIDDDPADERVNPRIGDLPGQFEPAAAWTRQRSSAECLEKSPRHSFAEVLGVAPNENALIDGAAVEHGGGEV